MSEAAWLVFVRAVAAVKARPGNAYCPFCGEPRQTREERARLVVTNDYAHAPDCVVLVARAWLADSETERSNDDGQRQ